MTEKTFANYLFDVGYELKTNAFEAKRAKDVASGEQRAYEQGRVMAYIEVINLMKETALNFGISLSSLRLDDIQPERDLLTSESPPS